MAHLSIAVIIPVLKEADTINPTLQHIDRLQVRPKLEVIVVDGDSRRTTLKAVRENSLYNIHLKTATAPQGRGAQMNAGAALSKTDILLFLHADTLISPPAIQGLQLAMKRDSGIVGGAFDLKIRSPKKRYRLIETMANARSRITRIPYGDQAIFIRSGTFKRLGGFADIPLMEDVELMRRIKKRKERIVILHQRVETSARRWEREGAVKCTLRNWLLISLYLLGTPPKRLAEFYKF
jgi:rSAM/selenodomain-associated transferase 2